jgi:two-component system CheB/CheR fusion protein
MNGPHFCAEGRDQRDPGLRLLVVDAYTDAADSMAVLLQLWGFDVRVAYTGLAGLETARRFAPDVVLAELKLPGLDGCQLAQSLRGELHEVTLIALTGLGAPAHRRQSRECGFAHHLVKPADPDEIHELVTLAVQRKRMTVAGPADTPGS